MDNELNVAEIFAEIERVICRYYHDNKISLRDDGLMIVAKHSARHTLVVLKRDIAELKKKYTRNRAERREG